MATIKQKKAFTKVVENGGNVSRAMVDVGYSEATAKTPQKLTDSDGWKKLMQTYIPDELLAQKHNELLNATGVDHMVFPTEVKDKEIIEFLEEANCKAKRIMHSEQATHVWFFIADNNARKNALEMAYKLKGRFQKEGVIVPVQININEARNEFE